MPASLFKSAMSTLASAFVSSRTHASPRPEAPPVTSTPLSLSSMLLSFFNSKWYTHATSRDDTPIILQQQAPDYEDNRQTSPELYKSRSDWQQVPAPKKIQRACCRVGAIAPNRQHAF